MTDRPPPAKGLRILTWPQVEQIDRCISEVCESGQGEVVIVIKRNLPRSVRPTKIHNLSPHYHEDFS